MTRRVAFVLPNLAGGGAERVALTLAEGFLERGHQVDLVLLQATGELMDKVPPGARLIDLKARRFRGALPAILHYLRSERPDGLQVSMWPLTVVAALAHRLARSTARLVLSDHNTLSKDCGGRGRLHWWLLRGSIAALYPGADARVIVSAQAADDLAWLGGLDRSSIEVIHNPIAMPAEAPRTEPAVEALWGPGPARRLLSVGGFREQKNQALLLDAFARLRQRVPARLMIVGEGPLRGVLEARAAKLGVADDVLLPGFRADVWPFYAAADLFVLSSDYEGFGNVLVEALASGVPVVSTDCESGPREILADGAFGALVPCGDAEALADAMEQALASRSDRDALKWRAAHFRPNKAVERYLGLLVGP